MGSPFLSRIESLLGCASGMTPEEIDVDGERKSANVGHRLNPSRPFTPEAFHRMERRSIAPFPARSTLLTIHNCT
jgi:hypothetical protein